MQAVHKNELYISTPSWSLVATGLQCHCKDHTTTQNNSQCSGVLHNCTRIGGLSSFVAFMPHDSSSRLFSTGKPIACVDAFWLCSCGPHWISCASTAPVLW